MSYSKHDSPYEGWVNDLGNKKYQDIKSKFYTTLQQHTKDLKIGYYDFLLVAKKLSFRFEESAHLMALKNYFSKNKNSVNCKNLADSLSINQQSFHSGRNINSQEKIIVKFNVPELQFAPIKQETLQDEEIQDEQDMEEQLKQGSFEKIGQAGGDQQEQELMQKMTIILSIKVEEMQKKLQALLNGFQNYSLLKYFNHVQDDELTYEIFKRGIIDIVSHHREKLKISEDDIKTLFYILDEEKKGYLHNTDLKKLTQSDEILNKMQDFYRSRINKEMVKNTMFKLGKIKSNGIQIYQLKNASLMEFKQIEDSILDQKTQRNRYNIKIQRPVKEKNRIPHFGPLKGATKWKKQQTKSQPHYHQFASLTHPSPSPQNFFSINKQRQKIEKILRKSKGSSVGRNQKNGQTVASKLRSLFIHKVILPREKMLEQQKQKFFRSKVPDHQLSIRPYK